MTSSDFAVAAQRPLQGMATAGKPLVVVVEDDYRASLALSMLIDDWGYSALPARCAREVVQTLGSRLFHVAAIVTDVEIDGEMRGIRDAMALAAVIGHPIPTIVTTGHGNFAASAGSFPVMRKPFDPDLLQKWLSRQLGRSIN